MWMQTYDPNLRAKNVENYTYTCNVLIVKILVLIGQMTFVV